VNEIEKPRRFKAGRPWFAIAPRGVSPGQRVKVIFTGPKGRRPITFEATGSEPAGDGKTRLTRVIPFGFPPGECWFVAAVVMSRPDVAALPV
jgi:hypothetical protein